MARKDALELVDELIRLEEETHPRSRPPVDKDWKARFALMQVEDLVEMLAGWAIDHLIGLAVNRHHGEAANPVDWEQSDTQRQADDHRHEFAESEYDFADPKINRHILTTLLEFGPGAFPIPIVIEATDALIALDMGETRPLVEPVRGVGQGRQAYTEWMLRYWAVLHVEFFLGMNFKRQDALAKVADAYHVEPDTIERWVSEVSKKLKGIKSVHAMKEYARWSGNTVYDLMVKGLSSDGDNRDERRRERIVARWGESALKRHGDEFQQVRRDTEGSVVPFSP